MTEQQTELLTRAEQRTIPIALNDEEVATRATSLELTLQKMDDHESEKKRWMAEWKGSLAYMAKDLKSLRKAVRVKVEDRSVSCLVTFVEEENRAVVRAPDGAEVEVRSMTSEELEYCQEARQLDLPDGDPEEGDGEPVEGSEVEGES